MTVENGCRGEGVCLEETAGKDSSVLILLRTARRSGWPVQEAKESGKVSRVHSDWLTVERTQKQRAIREEWKPVKDTGKGRSGQEQMSRILVVNSSMQRGGKGRLYGDGC